MISRRRFIGVFFHGTRRTSRSWSTAFWRITGCLRCLHLDRQLVRVHLESDDVVADEVSASTFCVIPEMLADGAFDERLDLGRRQPAHRSDTPRLSVQEG